MKWVLEYYDAEGHKWNCIWRDWLIRHDITERREGSGIDTEKLYSPTQHDDVIKWKHFPRHWPFVREIHRSPVNFPHKGQWRGALMFSLIYARINNWVNNREAGDLRRQHGHYDVIVMSHHPQCTTKFHIFNVRPLRQKFGFLVELLPHDRDGVSNHQRLDGLLNRLFKHRSKKTSKLCITGLCGGNSMVTGEFPSQRPSKAKNVSIWWRHHEFAIVVFIMYVILC